MISASGRGRGFMDPVTESQSIFRSVMDAFAAPARAVPIAVPTLKPPSPLNPLAAGVTLALCDFETKLWLDPALANAEEVLAYIRFQTGAVIVSDPRRAAFAVISDVATMPPLETFALGSAEYPDQSTTVILQVESLMAMGLAFDGPGFETSRRFDIRPRPTDFARQWQQNTALFPRGVDLICAAGAALAALPRSSRIVEAASCM
jgi:alpha-D-ribose 1-methylphosphonate 5-triphosphate synthase subunit PhnH